MIGVEAPETCWATHKRQVMKWWNCCIVLVDLLELKFRLDMCRNLLFRWQTISFWKRSLLHGTNYQKRKQHKRFFFHTAWLELANSSKEYLWGTDMKREFSLRLKPHVFIKVCRVELKFRPCKVVSSILNVFEPGTVPSCCCCSYEYLQPRESRFLPIPYYYQERLWHDACEGISKHRRLQTYFTWPAYNYSILGRSFPSAYFISTSA
jgi:hypothetical protein